MPNQPRTPGHMFRIEPGLFAAAKAIAASRNETLTHVVTEALTRYVRRHSAELSAPTAKDPS
jgi:predicted HicB family RNase H-like nuclease